MRIHTPWASITDNRELRKLRHVDRTSDQCAPVRICLQAWAPDRSKGTDGGGGTGPPWLACFSLGFARALGLQEASKTSRASALRQLRNPAAHWTGEIGAATVWTPGDLKWQSSALPASVRYLSSNNSTLLLQKRGLELIDLRTLEG